MYVVLEWLLRASVSGCIGAELLRRVLRRPLVVNGYSLLYSAGSAFDGEIGDKGSIKNTKDCGDDDCKGCNGDGEREFAVGENTSGESNRPVIGDDKTMSSFGGRGTSSRASVACSWFMVTG